MKYIIIVIALLVLITGCSNSGEEKEIGQGEQIPEESLEKSVNLEVSNSGYSQDTIRIVENQTLLISLTSINGTHSFVIDEFGVKSRTINAGNSSTIVFTPDKAGEFEFYSNVENDRERGVTGTLIVE